jgi:hypothetical protein
VHNCKQLDDRNARPSQQRTHSEHVSYLDHASSNFDQHCATCHRIENSTVRLRVPSVLFFVGEAGRESDVLMQELDDAHSEFAARRVQLVVICTEKPSTASRRLGLCIPILEDNGLSALFIGTAHDQPALAAVILANDGRSLGVLQSFPVIRPASPILGRIDRLQIRFPNLFSAGRLNRA